jgi:hypothetical protein
MCGSAGARVVVVEQRIPRRDRARGITPYSVTTMIDLQVWSLSASHAHQVTCCCR